MSGKQNIGWRLRASFFSLTLVAFVISVISLVELRNTNSRLEKFINGAYAADDAVKMCRIKTNEGARAIREMALTGDEAAYPEYERTVKEAEQEIETQLAALQNTGVIDEALVSEYKAAVLDWTRIGGRIIEQLKAGENEKAVEMILTECSPALENTVEKGREVNTRTEQLREETLEENLRSVNVNTVIIVACLVLSAGGMIFLSRSVIKSIMVPLRDIEEIAGRLSEGKLDNELREVSDDEIGRVARDMEESCRILSAYIADIDRAMKELSDGNFDIAPSQPFVGDFENIEQSISRFVVSMSEMIISLQQISRQVASASDQMSGSAQDLAQEASDQAGVVQELSASIIEVTDKINANARSAELINKDVVRVGSEIEAGNRKMQEMVRAMQEIQDTSNEIGEIIRSINDIAEQTNLLSLNASIEAARAGEAGRGFAVVADQVGKLAAESAQAAKVSNGLVEASVGAVQKGMELAGITAEELQEIVEGARGITARVEDIAKATGEQSKMMNQISRGVEQMSGGVQNNSASAQECAAASQELTGQAETLREMLGHFRTKEGERKG